MPPDAVSKRPARRSVAPVKAPRSWPKSSLSRRSRGIAEQLSATNGPLQRGGVDVGRARDELLAGAALAFDEDRRVALRDAADRLEDLLHRAAGADERDAGLVAAADLVADPTDRARQLVHLRGAGDERAHLVEVEGLGEVVEGAALHRLDRVRHGVLRRDHDDDEPGDLRSRDPLQHVETAQVRHPDVENGDVDVAAGQGGEGVGAGRDGLDVVPGLRQGGAEHQPDRFFVVGDEDSCHDQIRPLVASATGRLTRKRVPRPGSLSTPMVPPCWATRCSVTASPRPVPLFLVVKKGAKMRSQSSGAMPGPVSSTRPRGTGRGSAPRGARGNPSRCGS